MIPANYTAIYDEAFYGCSNLKSVHIPTSVTSIGANAFKNCSSSLVICNTTSDCTAKTYANENSITFKVCSGAHETAPVTSYTLTYNANGGSGAPSSQSGYVSYIISSVSPSRSGYSFLGWSRSRTATSPSYLVGDVITLTENTTLYAVWKENTVVIPPDDGGDDIGGESGGESGGEGGESGGDDVTEIFAEIKKPSTTTISYGDSIILHANVENLPEGATIEWRVNNGHFEKVASNKGESCRITPKSSGDTTVTMQIISEDGEILAEDEQVMTAKAGLLQKIIGFIKSLFGLTKTIPQLFKGIAA